VSVHHAIYGPILLYVRRFLYNPCTTQWLHRPMQSRARLVESKELLPFDFASYAYRNQGVVLRVVPFMASCNQTTPMISTNNTA
jgi:hypothetical protein